MNLIIIKNLNFIIRIDLINYSFLLLKTRIKIILT